MKKSWIAIFVAAALLLSLMAGCGPVAEHASEQPSQSVSAVPSAPPAIPDPTPEPTPDPTSEPTLGQDADGSYTSAVLDTAQDAGKLTVRYLAMQNIVEYDGGSTKAGDCAIYTSPEGLVMMVDCGNENNFSEIDACLKAMGIRKIDIFVMSHPHGDHIGCFDKLASYYPVGQVYRNAHDYDTGTFRRAMNTIRSYNIPETVLHDGDSFMFGEQVKVTVYGPTGELESRITSDSADTNSGSLAMRITYGQSSFWTAGDTYVKGELAMVDKYGDAIQSDIIKISHHGYETSSHDAYLDALSPKAAIAMYSFFTSATIARRHSTRGMATFYTCLDGIVRVSTAGDGTYDIQSQLIRRPDVVYGPPAPDGHYILN